MTPELLIPSLAAFSGGSIVAMRHYLKHRFLSHEDRYMALYGLEAWEGSNMDLSLHFDPELDAQFKSAFRMRLRTLLERQAPELRLLQEHVDTHKHDLDFVHDPDITLEQLFEQRHGVWFDDSQPGRVRVIWNHMQTDGVGMWAALRPLFDVNPPLVPYQEVPQPMPVVPELLSLPFVARRLAWKGYLHHAAGTRLRQGFQVWDAGEVRDLKGNLKARFNLLTCALVCQHIFARHPNLSRLQLGITVFFPFLNARNRYGVLTVRVKRGDTASVVGQIDRQVRHAVLAWGTSSATSYALSHVPDRYFLDIVGYFRKQIDVLVSNLPVGTLPITLDGVHTEVSCHPFELTLPYYFLIVGTRQELHVSYTARFDQSEAFARGPLPEAARDGS